MNGQPLKYSIIEYQTDLFFNENGEPEGIIVEHMKILSEYIDFTPILHVSKSFVEGDQITENGTARIGSPGAANFL